MSGIDILTIVIGVIFVYLLLSLLATICNEWLVLLINSRGKNLLVAIKTILEDPNGQSEELSKTFLKHPLFKKLSYKSKATRVPAYLDTALFSQILVDILSEGQNYRKTMADIELKIQAYFPDPESETRSALLSFCSNAGGSIDLFKTQLEEYYDRVMDRASGWYQRKIKVILIIIGLVMSIGFNANTFRIAHNLAKDTETRQAMLDLATTFVNRQESGEGINIRANSAVAPESDSLKTLKYKELNRDLDYMMSGELLDAQAVLGMGWSPAAWQSFTASPQNIAQGIVGWLITAIAISFGAPFWFDLLKKLINIRSSVPSKNKAST